MLDSSACPYGFVTTIVYAASYVISKCIYRAKK